LRLLACADSGAAAARTFTHGSGEIFGGACAGNTAMASKPITPMLEKLVTQPDGRG
jgi:carbonic anhydrase